MPFGGIRALGPWPGANPTKHLRQGGGERVDGSHTVHWDGLDETGPRAAGGACFYSLRAPEIEESRRMILLP